MQGSRDRGVLFRNREKGSTSCMYTKPSLCWHKDLTCLSKSKGVVTFAFCQLAYFPGILEDFQSISGEHSLAQAVRQDSHPNMLLRITTGNRKQARLHFGFPLSLIYASVTKYSVTCHYTKIMYRYNQLKKVLICHFERTWSWVTPCMTV